MSKTDQSKNCKNCGESKPVSEFHIHKNGLMGRQSKCKRCTSIIYYQPNKEKVLKSTRTRRESDEGRERERELTNLRRRENPLRRILQEAKVRACAKGLEYDILESDLFIPSTCPVLGIPIGMAYGKRSPNSISIDRVDTRKGYIQGNVRIISWRANRLKNDASLDEMRAIVQYMEQHIAK